MPRKTMIEAIRDAMDVMMERDDNVVVFGEDVGFFGGVFRATQGLQAKYGKSRCFDTPISELGIVGAAVGMAAYGLRPCVEIQFADYMYPAYDQIVSEAARLRYRSNGQFTCPLVVRMPTGGGIFGGQTHSQSPGGAVHPCVRPQDRGAVQPARCQGTADRGDRGPRSGDLPGAEAALQRAVRRSSRPACHALVEPRTRRGSRRPLRRAAGQGAIRREGAALTILAYGTMVHVAMTAAAETGIDAEIIDLRTLLPLDLETIEASVRKTGRCVIVHEATLTSGFGAELSALVQETCFYHLEAPVVRVAGWDTPYPHAQEWDYFPGPARVGRALLEAMGREMAEHVIRLPDVGEGVAEAELVEWHVKVGDLVREDAALAAVMTDKATVEIPSPVRWRDRLAGRRDRRYGRGRLRSCPPEGPGETATPPPMTQASAASERSPLRKASRPR